MKQVRKTNVKRKILTTISLACAVLLGLGLFDAQATLTGPTYPAPGGNTWSGSGDAGLAGGADYVYGILNPAQYGQLFWGPWNTEDAVASGLDYALHNMAFDHISGNQAVWTGNSYYSHVGDNSPPSGTLATRFTATITGLGSSPWVLGSSVGRPDVPALADVTLASGFTANLLFEVWDGTGYVPLLNIPNNGLYTEYSFWGGFYSAPVPEPTTMIAGALLLLPFGASTLRMLRRNRTA
jgi:hypothetical protein